MFPSDDVHENRILIEGCYITDDKHRYYGCRYQWISVHKRLLATP